MKASEIKEFIVTSLSVDQSSEDISRKLEKMGVSYTFSKDFRNKVINRIFETRVNINREMEFIRSLNFAFYRVALTGVAAIVILLISIFLMEGSISFNSFLGLSNGYDESIVYLLTGN